MLHYICKKKANQGVSIMARKSQGLRLSQAKETLRAYEAAGLTDASQARFMRDMIGRISNGRYPTRRQRDWLDSIIEEGVPAPKGDAAYIAKIDEALQTEGIDFAQVLTDFRGKLLRGWDLSAKQKSWCDSLIKKAEDIRSGDYWRPDETMTEKIKLAVSVELCYNDVYWATHGGGAAAMEKAKRWLTGDLKFIDEWTVNKLFKTVAGKLREMENPRFEAGDMGYLSVFNREKREHERAMGIIVGDPTPTRDGIAYEILVNGEVLSSVNIGKRR